MKFRDPIEYGGYKIWRFCLPSTPDQKVPSPNERERYQVTTMHDQTTTKDGTKLPQAKTVEEAKRKIDALNKKKSN
jgi:hypothetical protein